MTVPSTPMSSTSPLRKAAAVARAEGLRRFNCEEINKLLDALVDMSYDRNNGLTERERVCRFCNQLEALTGIPAQCEISEIIALLRSAFGLASSVNRFKSQLYASIKKALHDLDKNYPHYDLHNQLRPDLMLAHANSPVSVKAELSKLMAKLFVIAMNTENERFRTEAKLIIERIMEISFEWM